MLTDFIAGYLTSLALIVAIGAQNSFVLRQGLRKEHVLTVVAICALSDALLIVAGIAGVGAFVEANPALLQATRLGGAAFLIAYAFAAARRALQTETLEVQPDTATPLALAVSTCLAFTFLNPHVYLDTVVLLGSLAQQRSGGGRWVFGAGAVSASISWFFALGYGARLLRPWFAKPIAWRVLDSVIAVTMLGLAVALLMG